MLAEVAGNGAPIIAVLGHASYNVAWTLLDARDAYSPAAAAVAVAVPVAVLAGMHFGERNRRKPVPDRGW